MSYRHEFYDGSNNTPQVFFTMDLPEAIQTVKQHLRLEYIQALEKAMDEIKPLSTQEEDILEAYKDYCKAICQQLETQALNAKSFQELDAVQWPSSQIAEEYQKLQDLPLKPWWKIW